MALVRRLLEPQFTGRDELRQQLSGALVRTLDEEGSLEFQIASGPLADADSVVMNGAYNDVDGVPVELLLHVHAGKLAEFEIYKADGSAIRRRPDPGELELFVGAHVVARPC
jgi:hypothetical protein